MNPAVTKEFDAIASYRGKKIMITHVSLSDMVGALPEVTITGFIDDKESFIHNVSPYDRIKELETQVAHYQSILE